MTNSPFSIGTEKPSVVSLVTAAKAESSTFWWEDKKEYGSAALVASSAERDHSRA
jgi:hypothetical protein